MKVETLKFTLRCTKTCKNVLAELNLREVFILCVSLYIFMCLCVCVCVYMCVKVFCMCVFLQWCLNELCACVCSCISVWLHCMCFYMYLSLCEPILCYFQCVFSCNCLRVFDTAAVSFSFVYECTKIILILLQALTEIF